MVQEMEEDNGEGVPPHTDEVRRKLLNMLCSAPEFLNAAHRMTSDGRAFRVVMSEENAHLFKKAADGTFKPFLRDGGKFVENVDLVRLPPDYLNILTSIATQGALAQIFAKLDAISHSVTNLAELVRVRGQGELLGAETALRVARVQLNPGERREQMFGANRDIIIQLGAVAKQLKAHINQMPSERTDFWTGWWDNGIGKAEQAYARVRDDFAILADGLRKLIESYIDLNEPASALEAFSIICADIEDANLLQAIQKARLLPRRKEGHRPESIFKTFQQMQPAAKAKLHALAKQESIPLVIDVLKEELPQ